MRLEEAEPLVRRAIAIDEAAIAKDSRLVSLELCVLADGLIVTGRLLDAVPLLRRAFSIDAEALRKHHLALSHDLNILSKWLITAKRLHNAEPLVRRALAIDRVTFGDRLAVTADLKNLADILEKTDRSREAEPLRREVIANGVALWLAKPGDVKMPGAGTQFAFGSLNSELHAYRNLIAKLEKSAAVRPKIEGVLRECGLDDAMTKVVLQVAGYR
ncbi:MAG: tetratricopeptide repeat protein [Chthoniobacteraceae bacterium]